MLRSQEDQHARPVADEENRGPREHGSDEADEGELDKDIWAQDPL